MILVNVEDILDEEEVVDIIVSLINLRLTKKCAKVSKTKTLNKISYSIKVVDCE